MHINYTFCVSLKSPGSPINNRSYYQWTSDGRVTFSVPRDRLTYQIWLYSVNQRKGKPHGVQGGEHGGEPGLPNLPASRNSVKVVLGTLEGNNRDTIKLPELASISLLILIFILTALKVRGAKLISCFVQPYTIGF